MSFLARLNPTWSLRLGMGLMYIYSGFYLISAPRAWLWAIPFWVKQIIGIVMPVETFLRLHGGLELILAALLILPFIPKRLVFWAALVSALEMAGILFMAFTPFRNTDFLITFRDLGLLGGSLALTSILAREKTENLTQ